MKELAYNVERRAYSKNKNTPLFFLSAKRYPCLSGRQALNAIKSAIRYPLSATFIFCLLSSVCFAQQERFFEVKAKKFSYTPNIIEVNKGDLVRVRLISEDVHHGFYVDGYGISTSAHPGQDGSLKFTADKPGRFCFRCSVTCGEFHPYMVGYLVVKPNSRFNMYAAMVTLIGLGSLIIVFRKKENEQG